MLLKTDTWWIWAAISGICLLIAGSITGAHVSTYIQGTCTSAADGCTNMGNGCYTWSAQTGTLKNVIQLDILSSQLSQLPAICWSDGMGVGTSVDPKLVLLVSCACLGGVMCLCLVMGFLTYRREPTSERSRIDALCQCRRCWEVGCVVTSGVALFIAIVCFVIYAAVYSNYRSTICTDYSADGSLRALTEGVWLPIQSTSPVVSMLPANCWSYHDKWLTFFDPSVALFLTAGLCFLFLVCTYLSCARYQRKLRVVAVAPTEELTTEVPLRIVITPPPDLTQSGQLPSPLSQFSD